MKLMIATAAIALTASTTFAQDADVTLPELSKPEIAFVDAAAIAANAASGDLIAMELDYIAENDPVYLADLESDTGFARIMIDGDSGEILTSEIINAQTPEALEAYLENFSTQAEIAEMVELLDFVDPDFDDLELTAEELQELEELFMMAEEAEELDDTPAEDTQDN